ncbi:MAG: YbaB/EbfC family nucleoid-associated protein [Thermodesulfobacteriota bacterium]
MAGNIGNIMKQAQQMQAKIAEIQKEMGGRTCEASAGGGMVTALVNGNQELLSINIDPAVVDPDDVEMLQDLIVAAVNEGYRRSKKMVSDEMGKLTGGLGMDIPDMFK